MSLLTLLIPYILFCLLVIPIGLIIGIKLYNNVKNEEHNEKGKVIQRIIKTYSIVQCVAWPFLLVLGLFCITATATNFDESHPTLLSASRSTLRFLIMLTLSYVGFNSLIIAICRYTFIVFDARSSSIKSMRNNFVTLSILVPLAVATLHEATFPKHASLVNGYSYVNKTPEDNMAINITHYDNINSTEEIVPQSFLFTIVNNYFPNTVKTCLEILASLTKFVIFSNICEGLIYLHIYHYDKKSECKIVIGSILSRNSQIIRQRRKSVSIQMTIISWFIELIAGITALAVYFVYKKPNYVILLFNLVVNFIIIPGTYIVNTDACKHLILAQGWFAPLKRMCNSTRVSPLQNDAENPDKYNDAVSSNSSIADSALTISGNITSRQQRKKHQNVNFEMKRMR